MSIAIYDSMSFADEGDNAGGRIYEEDSSDPFQKHRGDSGPAYVQQWQGHGQEIDCKQVLHPRLRPSCLWQGRSQQLLRLSIRRTTLDQEDARVSGNFNSFRH